jgi:glucosamine-6-phosphate deaminase
MSSSVESKFIELSQFDKRRYDETEMFDSVIVNSFPELGMLTALRFIEYIQEKPNAVVSLPTGKTPEYFIKCVHRILNEWETPEGKSLRDRFGLCSE